MEQRIKRSALRPGMYVISHGLGTFDKPLVRVGKPLLTPGDIALLVPEDVEDVTVETSVNLSLLGQERPVGVPITTALSDELAIARKLHADALGHVKSFVDDVRRGTQIDHRAAKPLVENFIDSVFRNENAAITLFKLRGFDEYTYTHSINVSLLAILFGRQLGLERPQLLTLGLAGMYHDVGKARIPEAVLNKPGKLSEAEFQLMKTHPLEGYKIMANQPELAPEILRAVVEHHERHDGSGYPRGLTGDDIGLFSRIIAVVDVYDALTSRRVYKDAMAPAKALGMMYQWRDKDFPHHAIESFIRCVGVYPVGSFVRLSGGEYGIVASVNPLRPTKPEVKVVMDAKMRPQIPRCLDLLALEGTPQAQDIDRVLNPAEHKIDVEPFFLA
ncbi:HDIG domain-containing protein [Humidesulfovibrio mexicanus]|uniref:HDIG domain-containing protein n=1 Tax=Humidesulfovibrio mexicanus TaxID=147047 RepID=A0A239ASY3_9BACT|nr:HD-GYP domain-containing protein [Humidesulfovibrio mexicanus]SNR98073.1 HDIG domain-containing protein [Humidesulfovibrio mexicanus]